MACILLKRGNLDKDGRKAQREEKRAVCKLGETAPEETRPAHTLILCFQTAEL